MVLAIERAIRANSFYIYVDQQTTGGVLKDGKDKLFLHILFCANF